MQSYLDSFAPREFEVQFAVRDERGDALPVRRGEGVIALVREALVATTNRL